MCVYILMNDIFVYDSLIDQNINKRPIIKIICEETIFKYVSQSNMFVYYNLFENSITECSIRKVY